MDFIPIVSYDNYVPAHIAMGVLEEQNINCWLKDENSVTTYPVLTNALGGIKLMVASAQAERALSILRTLENEHKALSPCPKCNSLNIELISTPRKASNWASTLLSFFSSGYAVAVEKQMHCFDCGHEYLPDKEYTAD